MIGRYIVKKKIPEFSETKYSDNTLNNNDKFGIGLLMITENRLNNTISSISNIESIVNQQFNSPVGQASSFQGRFYCFN
jgi:hypothetical protein